MNDNWQRLLRCGSFQHLDHDKSGGVFVTPGTSIVVVMGNGSDRAPLDPADDDQLGTIHEFHVRDTAAKFRVACAAQDQHRDHAERSGTEHRRCLQTGILPRGSVECQLTPPVGLA